MQDNAEAPTGAGQQSEGQPSDSETASRQAARRVSEAKQRAKRRSPGSADVRQGALQGRDNGRELIPRRRIAAHRTNAGCHAPSGLKLILTALPGLRRFARCFASLTLRAAWRLAVSLSLGCPSLCCPAPVGALNLLCGGVSTKCGYMSRDSSAPSDKTLLQVSRQQRTLAHQRRTRVED